MIATGGLLRINARRQDSLRSKTRNTQTHKRKAKKKRRNEVVVVKGKLKLCSVSGLVAGLGLLVLMLGVVMAALGYWPREGLFFTSQPHDGTMMASISASSVSPSTPNETQMQGDNEEQKIREAESDDPIETEIANRTTRHIPQGFLEEFLDRYLYSDRLKVFGPLIMGIGIFLFICANAVLHENRDKKTKVINLRDIYSTVIDLHNLRRPNAACCSSANPLNSLVNYVQSKSLESKSRMPHSTSTATRRDGGGGGEEGGGRGPLTRDQSLDSREGTSDGGDGKQGDSVFSIYQQHLPDSTHRLPLPSGLSPTHHFNLWHSMQREELSSYTLPLRRPRPPTPQRRHSARGWTGPARDPRGSEEDKDSRGLQEEVHMIERREMDSFSPSDTSTSIPLSKKAQNLSSHLARSFQKDLLSCSSSSLQIEAPEGSQALLLLSSSSLAPSHMSFSSSSHLLSATSSTTPVQTSVERPRRRSLPSTISSVVTYSKLEHGDTESLKSSEALEAVTSCQGEEGRASQRKFSNREKLQMISKADCGLHDREEEEEGKDRTTNQKSTK